MIYYDISYIYITSGTCGISSKLGPTGYIQNFSRFWPFTPRSGAHWHWRRGPKKAACASEIAGKPKVEVNKSSAKSKKCKLFFLTLVTFDG